MGAPAPRPAPGSPRSSRLMPRSRRWRVTAPSRRGVAATVGAPAPRPAPGSQCLSRTPLTMVRLASVHGLTWCPRTTWTWGVGPSLRAAKQGWLRAKVRANAAWRLEALLGHLTQHRFGLFTSDPLSPTPCLCCCLFARWESAVERLLPACLPGRGQQGVCQPACLVVLLCAGVLSMYRAHWLGRFCVCADIVRAVHGC